MRRPVRKSGFVACVHEIRRQLAAGGEVVQVAADGFFFFF